VSGVEIKRLDHVGVVVDSLADGRQLLMGQFGLIPDGEADLEGLRIAFFKSGDARVELIEPTDPQVRERRLGDHQARIEHISFEVDDLEETMLALEALGIELTAPPLASGGRRNVWTVPATSDGIMFQFQQTLGS
jgi:methylmalonyl-CoA/ethylmalonyl-CoA epimerase